MTRRSGTGWPDDSKKYKPVPVQLLREQYDAIPQDIPVSQFIREAVEERLRREVPEYGRQSDGEPGVPGDDPAEPGGTAEPGACPA